MTMVSTPSRRRRDRRAVERLHRAFVALLVLVSSRSLARPVAADEYSATVERAISRSGGLQAIGAVDGLLEHLRVSLCEGDEAGCALYETARKDLWLSLGRDAICGAGEDDVVVHYSNFEGEGYRSLDEGQAVEFEVGPGRKGPEALNVRKV